MNKSTDPVETLWQLWLGRILRIFLSAAAISFAFFVWALWPGLSFDLPQNIWLLMKISWEGKHQTLRSIGWMSFAIGASFSLNYQLLKIILWQRAGETHHRGSRIERDPVRQ